MKLDIEIYALWLDMNFYIFPFNPWYYHIAYSWITMNISSDIIMTHFL